VTAFVLLAGSSGARAGRAGSTVFAVTVTVSAAAGRVYLVFTSLIIPAVPPIGIPQGGNCCLVTADGRQLRLGLLVRRSPSTLTRDRLGDAAIGLLFLLVHDHGPGQAARWSAAS